MLADAELYLSPVNKNVFVCPKKNYLFRSSFRMIFSAQRQSQKGIIFPSLESIFAFWKVLSPK